MKKTPLKRKKGIRRLRKDKGSLRLTADALWIRACIKAHGQRCEVCGKPADHTHHFFPRGSFARLRYEVDNGVILCAGCHMGIHFRGDPRINEAIIEKRGKQWFNKLFQKSMEGFRSANTVWWYQKNIEELKYYLEK